VRKGTWSPIRGVCGSSSRSFQSRGSSVS
jgi:hypothetical protein